MSQVFYILSVSGVRTTASTNPILPILAVSGFAAGIVSFVLAMISIFKFKKRSGIIYVIVAVGLIPVIFVLGEILVPH